MSGLKFSLEPKAERERELSDTWPQLCPHPIQINQPNLMQLKLHTHAHVIPPLLMGTQCGKA